MVEFILFLIAVFFIGIFAYGVAGPMLSSDKPKSNAIAAGASWEEIKERIDHQISVQRAPLPNTWFFRWTAEFKFEIEYQYNMPGRPTSFKLRAEYRDGMIHYDFDGWTPIGFRKDAEKERHEARLRALIS